MRSYCGDPTDNCVSTAVPVQVAFVVRACSLLEGGVRPPYHGIICTCNSHYPYKYFKIHLPPHNNCTFNFYGHTSLKGTTRLCHWGHMEYGQSYKLLLSSSLWRCVIVGTQRCSVCVATEPFYVSLHLCVSWVFSNNTSAFSWLVVLRRSNSERKRIRLICLFLRGSITYCQPVQTLLCLLLKDNRDKPSLL